jgi:hypothetical protein
MAKPSLIRTENFLGTANNPNISSSLPSLYHAHSEEKAQKMLYLLSTFILKELKKPNHHSFAYFVIEI